MKKNLFQIFGQALAFAPPLLLLFLGLLYFAHDRNVKHPVLPGIVDVYFWVGIMSSLIFFGGLFSYLTLRSKSLTQEEELRLLKAMNQDARSQNLILQNEVDLLAAMRDMSRVANDALRFEEALEKILGIMGSLMDSEEILIFIAEERGGASAPRTTLIPKARWDRFSAKFGEELDQEIIDDANVAEAFTHGRTFTAVEGQILSFAVPLTADNDSIGVIRVCFSLSGSAEDKIKDIEKHQFRVESISKHISLPIKTSHLYDQATIDAMTKLYTKRHFINQLTQALQVTQRSGKRASLIMVDIDHFKKVNDTWGHQTGDIILTGVAAILKDGIRATDTAYRYGGEEMAILLLGTSGEKVFELAERMRQKVKETAFRSESGETVHVTISMGIADFETEVSNHETLISRADKALYASKHGGRDQVTLWNPELDKKPTGMTEKILKNKI